MQAENQTFFATTPKGLELLLVDELKSLGASSAAEKHLGVVFTGNLCTAYRACLWSRFANRILLPLANFPAVTADALYKGIRTINWQEHFTLDDTFSIHCVSVQSEISHTLFATQKIKDAIADQFREKYDARPNVARDQPDISIYVYLYRNQATVYLDLSGESLHKRHYRLATGAAPLKENLAAAILTRARWHEMAAAGGTLLDPMCGSGTLLIEAGLIAADIAPGLLRDYFGFTRWKKHDAKLWEKLYQEASERKKIGIEKMPTIVGYDQDPHAVKIAFSHIEQAGLQSKIHVEKRELSDFAPLNKMTKGLIVTNPPYGERLGEVETLGALYTELGTQFKNHFAGWRAAVFTGNPQLGKVMGLRARRYYSLFNGSIPCQLLLFEIEAPYFIDRSAATYQDRPARVAQRKFKHSRS